MLFNIILALSGFLTLAALIFFAGPAFLDFAVDIAALVTYKVTEKAREALERWREILGR